MVVSKAAEKPMYLSTPQVSFAEFCRELQDCEAGNEVS